MKNRSTENPTAVLAKPIKPVGIALTKRMTPMGIRGPYLSQKGPRAKRMTIVPVTAAIDDVQTSSFVNLRDCCTSDSKGEIENLRKSIAIA